MSTVKNPRLDLNQDFQKLTGISDAELTNDTDRGLAMALLRIEQLELQNRLLMSVMAQNQGLPIPPGEKSAELIQSMKDIEAHRQQALANRPQLTEAERARLEQRGIAEAQQRLLKKHSRFKEHIKTCERVSIVNPSSQPVTITVQGVTGLFKPGKNNNVPIPFAQALQDMIDGNEEAMRRDALIALREDSDRLPEYGMLADWIQAGRDDLKENETLKRDVLEFD